MQRRFAWCVLIALCMPCLAFGPAQLAESDLPGGHYTLQQIAAMRPVARPEVGAASAILVNPTTGQILYALNEHERRAPASLTKIVTAVVALQHERQDKKLVTTSADIMVYSVLGLQPGEGLTLRELLYYLLVPSDNASALTIARCVGGDIPTFVGWMNELVASWGLQNTHFMNPHGIDREGAYTTAFDEAIASYYAMQNPVFAEIVREALTYQAGRTLESTNELLTTYSGTIGVKTGTTDEAGQCLAAWVKRPTGEALTVVMGSEDRFSDSVKLLDYFYANYAEVRVDLAPSDQNRYRDAEGNWHAICLRTPVTLLVHPAQAGNITVYRRIDTTDPTHDPAQPVGVVQIALGGRIIREEAIYLRP
jgi:D-alanyl-D-alanine carboxypeptidase (penicillin-binding protein 5/6)